MQFDPHLYHLLPSDDPLRIKKCLFTYINVNYYIY
jgi:hypothetical protein